MENINGKEIIRMNFSDNSADVIIKETSDLIRHATFAEYGKHGIINEFKIDNYDVKNAECKKALLAFASGKCGIKVPENTTELAFAMDNSMFKSIINSIVVQSLAQAMINSNSPQLDMLSSREIVPVGGSKSYDIDTKSLPIAQKASYGNNVALVPSYAKSSVTVTPKPYTLGISLDWSRILGNQYDWGRALARIHAGMLFAQYKLVVDQIFSTTVLSGTPLYTATFTSGGFVQMADDLGMLNGGSAEDVQAFGVRTAWNTIGGLATSGGFTTKDEYIRNAFLQKVYGVDAFILDQFTDLSAPFNSTNASTLRTIPTNLIVMASKGSDKLVKLVVEDYMRVIETPANNNTANRFEYTYFQNFDAKLATASYFAVQNTASGS